VVPVREGHVLQLDFDIPPTDKLYKQVRAVYFVLLCCVLCCAAYRPACYSQCRVV